MAMPVEANKRSSKTGQKSVRSEDQTQNNESKKDVKE
jgi:hypothetical protein